MTEEERQAILTEAFPPSVQGYTRGETVASDFPYAETFPPFVAKDKVIYTLTNLIIRQVLSNDKQLKAMIDALTGRLDDNDLALVNRTLKGLMSAEDKIKLDGIDVNANAYIHPESGVIAGTYNQITVNEQGHITAGVMAVNTPVGTVLPFAAASPPAGYLLCNGQSVSRTTYSKLFSVIGVTYGADNNSTFKVPDLRDRFIVGAGNSYSVGTKGGAATVQLTINELPSHAHGRGTMEITGSFAADNTQIGTAQEGSSRAPNGAFYGQRLDGYDIDSSGSGAGGRLNFAASRSWTGETSYTGNSRPHENRPPYFGLMYIIKY